MGVPEMEILSPTMENHVEKKLDHQNCGYVVVLGSVGSIQEPSEKR